jgi:hypothetical protein
VCLAWLCGCNTPLLDLVETGSRKPVESTGDQDAPLAMQTVVRAPTLNPAPGAYIQTPTLAVTLDAGTTAGAQILYSLDPDAEPVTPYTGAITLDTSGFIKAVVIAGGTISAPAQGAYWLRNLFLYSVDAGDPDPTSSDATHELGSFHAGSAEDRAYFSPTFTPVPDPQTDKLWGYENPRTSGSPQPAELPEESFRQGWWDFREKAGEDNFRGRYVAYRFQLEDDIDQGDKRYYATVGLRYPTADLDEVPLNVWLAPDGGDIAADTAKLVGRMRIRQNQAVETSFVFSSDDLFVESGLSARVARIAIECQAPKPGSPSEFAEAPIGWLKIYTLY